MKFVIFNWEFGAMEEKRKVFYTKMSYSAIF